MEEEKPPQPYTREPDYGLALLGEDVEVIITRKSLNKIVKNKYSSMILDKSIYWAKKYNWGPFYKFRKPPSVLFDQNTKLPIESKEEYCQRVLPYRLGDSWCEELKIDPKTFDSALKIVAHQRGKTPQTELQTLITHWTNAKNISYYQVNKDSLILLLSKTNFSAQTPDFPPKYSGKRFVQPLEKREIYRVTEFGNSINLSLRISKQKSDELPKKDVPETSKKGPSAELPKKVIPEASKKGNSPVDTITSTNLEDRFTSEDVILRKITLRAFPKTEKRLEPSALNLGSEKTEGMLNEEKSSVSDSLKSSDTDKIRSEKAEEALNEKESLLEKLEKKGSGGPEPLSEPSALKAKIENSLNRKEEFSVEDLEKEEHFIDPDVNTHSHEPVPELPKETPPVERSRRGWSFYQNMPMSVSVRPKFERKEEKLSDLPPQEENTNLSSPEISKLESSEIVSSQGEISQPFVSSTPYMSPVAKNLNEIEEQVQEPYLEQKDSNSGHLGVDRTKLRGSIKKPESKPPFISQSTQEILDRWNGSGVLQKTTINPEKPSKILKDTVSAIKSLFKGNFFQNLEGVGEYNKEFTKKEIFLSIDRFIKKVSSPEYNSKAWMRKTGLLNFFYYQGPTEQKGVQRSLFLQHLLEEPKKNGCKEVANPDEYTMKHLKKAFEDYVYNGAKLTLSVYDKNKLARGAELLIKAMQDYAPLAIMSVEECAVKTVKGLLWRYEKLEKEVHIGMLGEKLTYHKTLIEYLSHIRRI